MSEFSLRQLLRQRKHGKTVETPSIVTLEVAAKALSVDPETGERRPNDETALYQHLSSLCDDGVIPAEKVDTGPLPVSPLFQIRIVRMKSFGDGAPFGRLDPAKPPSAKCTPAHGTTYLVSGESLKTIDFSEGQRYWLRLWTGEVVSTPKLDSLPAEQDRFKKIADVFEQRIKFGMTADQFEKIQRHRYPKDTYADFAECFDGKGGIDGDRFIEVAKAKGYWKPGETPRAGRAIDPANPFGLVGKQSNR